MRLTHVFVDSFPEPLEPGKLYVSMQYASVAHSCACGCGAEVVTPIRRRGWRLAFDGESITLSPSIGSHNLACQSHYLIIENEVRWAGRLSKEAIQAGRFANQQGGLDYTPEEEKLEQPQLQIKNDEAEVPSLPSVEPKKPWLIKLLAGIRRRFGLDRSG